MDEFVVLYGIVGIIRMEGSSRPRMKERNDVPNDAGEERKMILCDVVHTDVWIKGSGRVIILF